MQRAAGNRHAHRGVVVKMWPSRSWSRRTCSFNSTTLRNTKQVMALMSSEWAAPDSSPGCWPRILVRRLGCQGVVVVDNVLPRDWRPRQQMYNSLLSRVDICLLGSKEPSPIESLFTQSPLQLRGRTRRNVDELVLANVDLEQPRLHAVSLLLEHKVSLHPILMRRGSWHHPLWRRAII